MITLNLIRKYKFQPPFFIYDRRIIKRQFLALKNLLAGNFRIFYSVKSNPNIHILKVFKELGAGMEISSAGELKTALKAGFSPDSIIFTGPGKTNEELKCALNKKIYLIIAESVNEVGRIAKISKALGMKQNVLLRVNPSFLVRQSGSMFPMSGAGQKFGIDEKKIPEAINLTKGYKNNVNLLGLHFFTGSNIFDEKLVINNTAHLFKFVQSIESKFNSVFPIIDIGGGLAVNYTTNSQKLFNIKNLTKGLKFLVRKYQFRDRRIFLESGRFLIGEAGEYIAEVVDKKVSHGEKFIIINGGVNHVSRATLSKRDHAVEVLNKNRPGQKEIVNIAGNLNTPTDFITRVKLPKIEIGDLISIKKVGGYGFSSGMLFFSSHTLPKEYLLLEDGKFRNISGKIRQF